MKRKRSSGHQTNPSKKKKQTDLFALIPHEIKNHIAEYLDEVERNHLRLVSSEWPSLIQISLFRIGCVPASKIKALVYHFSRYQRPIGLNFTKASPLVNNSIREIAKLTQLTSLEFESNEYSKLRYEDLSDHLTKLTNLQRLCGVHMNQADLLKLSQLTHLTIDDYFVPKNPNLRSLHVLQDYRGYNDDINDINTYISSLTVEFEADVEEAYIKKFINLKQLRISPERMGDIDRLDTSSFTQLESLESEVFVSELPSTLTKLVLMSKKWNPVTADEFNPSNLTNLRVLHADLIYKNTAITILTNLESLSNGFGSGSEQIHFSYFQRLTRLEMRCARKSSLFGIGLLTKLRVLSLLFLSYHEGTTELLKLTGLAELKLQVKNTTHGNTTAANFLVAEPFQNLTSLTLTSLPIDNQISDFTQLQQLSLIDVQFNQISSLDHLNNLTQLTYLKLSDTLIPQCLNSLTNLRQLALNHQGRLYDMRDRGMINGEILKLSGEQQRSEYYYSISSLTSLQKLTKLVFLLDQELPNYKGISKLTALESLYVKEFTRLQELVPLQNLTSIVVRNYVDEVFDSDDDLLYQLTTKLQYIDFYNARKLLKCNQRFELQTKHRMYLPEEDINV